MTHLESARELQAKSLISAIEKRNMTAYYCENKEACLQKVLEILPEGCTIAWGGSESIKEAGIPDAVKESGKYTVYDRAKYLSPRQVKEFNKLAFSSDYYFMSSNAITLDGMLMNIDGNGNRVAAIIYGPGSVVVIAGMNKVTDDLESAITRARTVAAPINQQRFGLNNPCTVTGTCADCKSETCICNHIVVTRHCRPVGRIKFILVGEELGF